MRLRTRARMFLATLMAVMMLALPALATYTTLSTSSNKVCPSSNYRLITTIAVDAGAASVTLQWSGYETWTNDPVADSMTRSDTDNDGEISYTLPVWQYRNIAALGGKNRVWTDAQPHLNSILASTCVYVGVG